MNAVLLIFVNGVLQKPGEAYQFQGGTTFDFTEAPRPEAKVDIFFYKGQDGIDIDTADIQETVKVGDELRVFKHPVGLTTTQRDERTIKELLGAKLIETDIYTGPGIDENNDKPVRWTKQKVDIILNGKKIDKSREILEAQIYPTAKIIGDFSTVSGNDGTPLNGIFVDDVRSFFYEKATHIPLADRYNLTYNSVDALISSGEINVGASATAIVSAAGSVTSFDITNAGSGYSGTALVKISGPVSGIGTFTQSDGSVGTYTTATATATINNGSISAINVVNQGLGYTSTTPPQVIINLPEFRTEKITEISNIEGFTGIITGITTTTGTGGHPLALKFFFRSDEQISGKPIIVGYPVFIKDTKVGSAVTSVDSQDSSIVAIGTTFVDNIYKVHAVSDDGAFNGEITCNIHTNSSSSVLGIAQTGNFDPSAPGISTELGVISWGRIFNATRSDNPISIGVTGLTVNSGLTTFPTIQRKNYSQSSLRGLRSTGAIRVFGL